MPLAWARTAPPVDGGLIRSSAGAGEEAPLANASGVEAETELLRERECPLIFVAIDAAGDLLILSVLADFAGHVVLGHQVHVAALPELLCDEA